MPSDIKSSNLNRGGITPEMRELQRIMYRMTPDEKKAYKRKYYDEKAKPQLLELIEYCQSDNRICPRPLQWNRIVTSYMRYTDRIKFTKHPPFQLPLVLSTWHYSSDTDKRLRLLTQIYWCYKNYSMGSMYRNIMNVHDDDWHYLDFDLSKVPLADVKKEYASWLGVNSYDPVNNSISRSIRWAKNLDLTDLNEVDRFLLDTRKTYELNHGEFTPLYAMVLKYAIKKSAENSNESLVETVILVLKDKTKDYPELLEYALSASRNNHQLKRVMYNLFREDIEEVRDYKGDGSSVFLW
jgi:hypothetical protein